MGYRRGHPNGCPRSYLERVGELKLADFLTSRTIAEIERLALIANLIRYQGNRTYAAKAMGVSRRHVSLKIKLWKIDIPPGPVHVGPRKKSS
jgi:DNA-binding NtrC family response regulator